MALNHPPTGARRSRPPASPDPKPKEESMLALTPTATQAVETIVAQPDAPAEVAVRISAGSPAAGPGGPGGLRIAVVERPEDEDLAVEGARVFLDAGAADALAGKMLDADIKGERIRFSLRARRGD